MATNEMEKQPKWLLLNELKKILKRNCVEKWQYAFCKDDLVERLPG
jgi:hypothetical protein